jgi:hypothetical protein
MHHEEHVISEVCWEIVLLTSYEFSWNSCDMLVL